MKINSFSRKERLKKNSSIRDVLDKGTSFRRKSITVFLLKRKDTESRINRAAFTSRRHLYNKKLVLRNRIRRLLKEAYRKTRFILPSSYDIVILATNVKKGAKATALEKEMRDVFKEYAKK